MAPSPALDQLFTDLAKRHLGIATLETRRSDRLDFHEVAVWAVRDALRAAWEAGRHSATGPELSSKRDGALPLRHVSSRRRTG